MKAVTLKLLPAVACISLAVLLAFELTKQWLWPEISLWQSHTIPVVFGCLLTTGLAYFVLRNRQSRLDAALGILRRRKEAESQIRQADTKEEIVLQSISEMVLYQDTQLQILWANQTACRHIGASSVGALVGRLCRDVLGHTPEQCETCPIRRALQTGRAEEEELRQPNGDVWRVRANPVRDEGGAVTGVVTVSSDVTERTQAEEENRKLESKIQQAQKLESLGILAGGIAHDFNNLLVGILGNADLASGEIPSDAPAQPIVGEIKKAALRAADLAGQMLAYSGKGSFIIKPLCLNELVRDMARLLKMSLPNRSAPQYDFADDSPLVDGDAGQLRQVVMNLITNAADATGSNGGEIRIRTFFREMTQEDLSKAQIGHHLPGGVYVGLEVADAGVGMSDETKHKIFDPFFSTKFTGRGLGLAAVLGIVRGHGGAIHVDSQPGRGTTFQVFLPRSRSSVKPVAVQRPVAPVRWRGEGTVLVVDDEPTVRKVVKAMLTRSGFSVLLAETGQEAVDLFRLHDKTIRAVLLDLTMPGTGGEETFRELRALRSDVRIVLSSGYKQQDVADYFVQHGLAGFLHKPYEMNSLIRILRTVIEAPNLSDLCHGETAAGLLVENALHEGETTPTNQTMGRAEHPHAQ